MRWLWIDRFVAFESGRSATAVKALSAAEDHFADHFPGYPVMPAALLLEGLAQTGGILAGEARGFREKVVLAKVPKKGTLTDLSRAIDQLPALDARAARTIEDAIAQGNDWKGHRDPWTS